jgi:hypothetical protein
MFWIVRAPHYGNGIIAVQGTVHLGRDELYPLAPAVLDSLRRADVVLAELSPGDLARSRDLVMDHMTRSVLEGGQTLMDLLPTADVATLEVILGQETLRRLAIFQPWVACTVLELSVASRSGLDPDRGVDSVLYLLAEELGKPVKGLETAEFQTGFLVGLPLETQVLILRDSIQAYRDQPDALERLYTAYRTDDRQAMSAAITAAARRSQAFAAELTALNRTLLHNRNASWARELGGLLKAGKNIFVFAGVGHFMGDGNVFEHLEVQLTE